MFLFTCFLLLAFLFWFFASVATSLALASQAAIWSVSRHLHSEALLVFRTNGSISGFVTIFWGVLVLRVCVLHLNGEGWNFSTSLDSGLICHGIRFSTLTIDESLSLRVGEGDADGWRSRIFSTGLYRACYIE
jgi:hypothetical protein